MKVKGKIESGTAFMIGFIAIVSTFFLLFGLLNYYIGLRGWQYLGRHLPFLDRALYWWLFWAVALSYLAARLGGGFLPDSVRYVLTIVGAYWMGAMLYLIQLLLLLDLVRLLDRWLNFIPASWKADARFAPSIGVMVVVLVAGILVYGTWNARNPRLQSYDITIPKQAGELDKLHLIMVSDIHLGEIIHNGRLTEMVTMVNSLNPDILLLPGDVIDEDIGPFVKQGMADSFRQIRTKYGIYAVPGNHEYIRGHIDEAVFYLEQAGVRVLRDSYVKVADSFYIVGRDDSSHVRFDDKKTAQDLVQVMEGVDRSYPVILMNHQPRQLEEALSQGVDLQLSGHTHRGQMFPLHLVTGRLFEQDWGYLRKDSLQLIVSSGFGTWGPPIRTGNYPEIVEVRIRFSK